MKDEKEKGILIGYTDKGLKPIAPIDKDASLGDILVMKEMFGDKKDSISAVFIDKDLKWKK